MNYASKNFKALPVNEVSDKRLREIEQQDRAEVKQKLQGILDQTYQFDLSSFEANALKAQRAAHELKQEPVPGIMKKKEPGIEDTWEQELIDVNPLLFFTSVKEIDFGSGRKLSFKNDNGIPSVQFETPTLSVSSDQLLKKEIEADDIVEEKFVMGLNEFLHRLKTAGGDTFPAKAREAGFFETTEVIHSLEKNFLEQSFENRAGVRQAA